MRKYSLKKDSDDSRDYKYENLRAVAGGFALPETVDLRPLDAEAIFDQGYLGSCEANAACAFMSFLDKKNSPINAYFHYSRLFHYWKVREIMGTTDYDSGATIRDGMKVMHKVGCAGESTYPYFQDRFTDEPTQEAYATAEFHKLSSYMASYWRIGSVTQLKQSLADGFPVMLGVEIYSSFESSYAAMTGVISMPDKAKEYFLGGHALLAMGYTHIDGEEYIIARNSWGADWGDKGYCYLPMGFLGRYITDMWTGR
jgi:C1A family cysteine protease